MRGRLSFGLLAAVLAIGGLGVADGGYFAPAWGITAGSLGLAAAIALARARTVGKREACFVGGLALVLLYTALSLTWTASVTLTMLELERVAAYAACAAAFALLARGRDLLDGAILAATLLAAWALVDHLLIERTVDPYQGALLAGSVGYANGLGALVAIAAVAAVAAADDADRPWPWIAAAQLLLCALALTNSRGAAVALVAGVVVAVVFTARPLRLLLVVAILGAVATAIGSLAAVTGATRGPVPSADVVWEARLTLLLVVLATAAAPLLERRIPPLGWPVDGRRPAIVAGVAAALCVLPLAVVVGLGDRGAYWAVAADAFRDAPFLGWGPGTFERLWAERRTESIEVRDAHSLYLETLAEQGVVGTVLLLAALAVPLVALRGRVRGGVAVAGLAGYAAFLVHAALDWDWELPVVTVTGLAAGMAALLSTSSPADRVQPTGGVRGVAATALAAVALGSLAALTGNWRVSDARAALDAGRAAAAFRSSTRAETLQPWSSEPLLLNAQSRLALGDRLGAHDRLVAAVARDPGHWLGWWLLAAVSEDAAERRLAADQARRLNPLAPGLRDP
jgi:hypothetical protein